MSGELIKTDATPGWTVQRAKAGSWTPVMPTAGGPAPPPVGGAPGGPVV